MCEIAKQVKNIEKGRIDLGEFEYVKRLIEETESGMYASVTEDGENVLVYVSQNVGMEMDVYQKNKWIRRDTYSKEGFKTDEEFIGRY